MDKPVRVRFAPSPTGPLHIGGVRTALYNYLFARKHGGQFILRIEDTDQGRYVEGAEQYITDALHWCGIHPDESPDSGGEYGPYRQSERKEMYKTYARKLVESGHAYYAFDTPEELEDMRNSKQDQGVHSPTYNAETRSEMRNSLTLSSPDSMDLIARGMPYVVRLKVDPNEAITFTDAIREEVTFNSSELDDKVLLKADGMPTYHLANVVDDHLMKISHVIRGEEWLSSTAHHVLLYRAFGFEDMPTFAHLPLILKPTGKGKLSKRDGQKLGIPVFPLRWEDSDPDNRFDGFKDVGFLPEAVLNFLAFLGWSPGTEQEIFSLEELVEAFALKRVSKGGARFDYDKAKWYNQQYIKEQADPHLAATLQPWIDQSAHDIDPVILTDVCRLMKERVEVLPQIIEDGYYFFTDDIEYDEKTTKKKFKEGVEQCLFDINEAVQNLEDWSAEALQTEVKTIIEHHELGLGAILPLLRLSMAGTLKGPDLFDMIILKGKSVFNKRLLSFISYAKALTNA